MSNTASLENCKRLHELSGWRATEKRWYGQAQFPDSCVAGLIDNFDSEGICPAYDAGYLLRKLPREIRLSGHFESFTLDWYAGQWSVRYGLRAPVQLEARADTPEDALCLLAIKLFEEGILK